MSHKSEVKGLSLWVMTIDTFKKMQQDLALYLFLDREPMRFYQVLRGKLLFGSSENDFNISVLYSVKFVNEGSTVPGNKTISIIESKYHQGSSIMIDPHWVHCTVITKWLKFYSRLVVSGLTGRPSYFAQKVSSSSPDIRGSSPPQHWSDCKSSIHPK